MNPTSPSLPTDLDQVGQRNSGRIPGEAWLAIAAALVGCSVYLIGLPKPLSNIDDYNLLPFKAEFGRALVAAWRQDASLGRFRPLYWVFEGGLGALSGGSESVLHVGRLAFLFAAVGLQVRLALQLGAVPIIAAALAVLVAWSSPALEVWGRGGPSEAFAQPLALAASLMLLRARRVRGLTAASLLGLAACLTKESYAAWTAGAFLAFAVWAILRGDRRLALTAAVGGIVQFVPAVVPSVFLGGSQGDYTAHVLFELSASPLGAAGTFLATSPTLAVLGAAAAVTLLVRLPRRHSMEWPVEDMVVLGALGAAAAGTFAPGLTIPRYQLPLVTMAAVACAAASAPLAAWRPVRQWVTIAAVLLLPLAAASARAYYYLQLEAVANRADQRIRGLLAEALVSRGEVRILWHPDDVERPIGALKHLQAAGIRGRAEIVPCTPFPVRSEGLLRGLLDGYQTPVSAFAPNLASVQCGLFKPFAVDRACTLRLPGPGLFLPVLKCRGFLEPAALLGSVRD